MEGNFKDIEQKITPLDYFADSLNRLETFSNLF